MPGSPGSHCEKNLFWGGIPCFSAYLISHMPSEPERPIERLLRDSANKRLEKAGAPLSLHSADRRALQAEVARQFGKRQVNRVAWTDFLGRHWPRLAGVAVFLAVVGLSIFSLTGRKQSAQRFDMAKNDQSHSGTGSSKSEAGTATLAASELQPESKAIAFADDRMT